MVPVVGAVAVVVAAGKGDRYCVGYSEMAGSLGTAGAANV